MRGIIDEECDHNFIKLSRRPKLFRQSCFYRCTRCDHSFTIEYVTSYNYAKAKTEEIRLAAEKSRRDFQQNVLKITLAEQEHWQLRYQQIRQQWTENGTKTESSGD